MTDRSVIDFAARSAQLTEAAILGDRRAFGQLLTLWHPRLLAFARKKAGTEAEDVLQAALLTMAKGLPNLRDPKRFGPWAMTIIARRAADRFDTLRRERRKCEALGAEPDPPVLHQEERLATRDALRKALAELPAEQRTLLTLHYIDGLTGRDIALLLNLPLGTVKSRLHTARNKLRAAYLIQKGDENG